MSLDLASADLHAFKWVVLSLHSALQGACVCHLTTTAQPLGATTAKNSKEWLDYFGAKIEGSVPRPDTRIAELPELLKRLRRKDSAGDGSLGSGIELTESEFQWWKRIHDRTRNQFVHFSPMGWSIELSGIPELIVTTVRIIDDIDAAGWAFRHMIDEWRERLREALRDLERSAAGWAYVGKQEAP